MKKLILRNNQSPGDIVMLTAAVRDLHLSYPGEFITDVRSSCKDLWLNNPYLSPLSEADPDVQIIECEYPLVNVANARPFHFIHGFIDFLNTTLQVSIKPTNFHGDVHLTESERAAPPGFEGVRYWLIVAGGKFDYTIKWWSVQRYQEVVDHFQGRIVFVQVGREGHYHPPLSNVIDLRGKTTLRDLVRLVYFADGCITPVSLVMHLAPAIEARVGSITRRPCVVVAGGREPPHWEAYPTHTFLHTVGALRCCATGGCWRSRTRPIGDNDIKDEPRNLCVDVVDDLPRCMDMIRTEDVISAVDRYLEGWKTYGTVLYHSREKVTIPKAVRNNIRKVAFVTVSDFRFWPGTVAACNSIRHCQGDRCDIIVINSNVRARGLTTEQQAILSKRNIVVRGAQSFAKGDRKLGAWELKAYGCLEVARCGKYDVVIGIDSDCILCSDVNDVVHECSITKCFAGGRDRNQYYDESFSIYGIEGGTTNRRYMSTSLYFCPLSEGNLRILDRWAACCAASMFGGTGEYPGHGDQGVLNAVMAGEGCRARVTLLENRIWSQHWTYWRDEVDYDSLSDGMLNRSFGGRQRAFHSGGTYKFWDIRHSKRVRSAGGRQEWNYAWFLFMISLSGELMDVLQGDGKCNHLCDDYEYYGHRIREFKMHGGSRVVIV